MAYTHLDPGVAIEVSNHVYHSSDKARVFELVKLPLEELKKQETASIEKEKEIFSKFSDIEAQWTAQAAETVSLREAQVYLKARPVEHTSNQWKNDQYDRHELSNMVYQMSYRVYEQTRYDRSAQKSVTVAWELTWDLSFNTIQHPDPDNTGPGWKIAGQDRKRFTDKAAMEKYLQGRIAAYAHLFTVISPPIPKGQEKRFSVHGVLLPGYTVEVPERTPQEVANELLDFLDDGDIGETTPASEIKQPPTAAVHHKSTPKKSTHSKRNHTAPTR